MAKMGTVWESFRDSDQKTKKSHLGTHESEAKHIAAVKLMASRSQNDKFWFQAAKDSQAKQDAKRTEFREKKMDQVRSVLFQWFPMVACPVSPLYLRLSSDLFIVSFPLG